MGMGDQGRQITPISVEAAELAREMEGVNRALANAAVLLAGIDQADGARDLTRPAHSPLRTVIEHAAMSAARVTKFLREIART